MALALRPVYTIFLSFFLSGQQVLEEARSRAEEQEAGCRGPG
jgi:hypothetical protein